MKKQRQRARSKVTPLVRHDAEFLADQIDAVATLMWALAERMEYYAGFSGELNKHGREMAGASVLARGWAKAIRCPNAGAQMEKCFAEWMKTHNAELSGGEAVRSDDLLAVAVRERNELRTQMDAWHSVFGTTQLSHAQARLEAAEDAVRRLTANMALEG
jgi:hypothetical protein